MTATEAISGAINRVLGPLADFLQASVFYSVPVAGADLPLIVVWLIGGGVFFTLWFGFINIRGLGHGLALLFRKPSADQPGQISPFQALSTALSGTVGLGNIAGAAVAIAIGGPGSSLRMVIAGFLGMSTKFIECTLAVKYRVEHDDGTVSGGPMYYLSRGLSARNMPILGKVLGVTAAVAFPFASLNLLQVNQSYAQFAHATGIERPLVFGVVLASAVGAVIFGGIRSIGAVAERIVPLMCGIYLTAGVFILVVNAPQVPGALWLIVSEAFTPHGVAGGIVGALVAGVRRAVYSNEAGLGSSAVAHAAVKTDQPLTEGFVALLEPLIDSCIVCLMTALIVVVTGAYQSADGVEGVVMTSRAFATVLPWFPWLLTVSVILFAFSTIISWFYYGLKGFTYLVGHRPRVEFGYKIAYCCFLAVAAVVPLDKMVDLADGMNFVLAIPNLIGLYILSGEVRRDLNAYWPNRPRRV